VITILSIPFILITLGLFFFVVNAFALWITSGLAGWLGLGEVRVGRRGGLARALAAALRPRPGRARRRARA
jgi:putative membrane protein